MKEWKLVADVAIENGTTQVKVPVDNYKEYIIYGNIVAESNKTLYIAANREGYDWTTHRITALANGVNSNSGKRFYVKIEKISESYIEVHASANFEGVGTVSEMLNMREINLSFLGKIEYFWFSAADSSELAGGNIKIFAR